MAGASGANPNTTQHLDGTIQSLPRADPDLRNPHISSVFSSHNTVESLVLARTEHSVGKFFLAAANRIVFKSGRGIQ
ncbi:MAG: hypothetical protein K0S45_4228 [Nitrospira sp.]|nr:hypothetical protein [Nitrospira sp.]